MQPARTLGVGAESLLLVPQAIGQERAELDTPVAQRLVTDQGAVLVQQFLHVTGVEWKAVIDPKSVLDGW